MSCGFVTYYYRTVHYSRSRSQEYCSCISINKCFFFFLLTDRVLILYCLPSTIVPMVCCGTWLSRSECGQEHKERKRLWLCTEYIFDHPVSLRSTPYTHACCRLSNSRVLYINASMYTARVTVYARSFSKYSIKSHTLYTGTLMSRFSLQYRLHCNTE